MPPPDTTHTVYANLLKDAGPAGSSTLLSLMMQLRQYRQLNFAFTVAWAQIPKHPVMPLDEQKILCGIIDAVEDSGIDLSDATSQADITGAILAYLVAGKRALESNGGDA